MTLELCRPLQLTTLPWCRRLGWNNDLIIGKNQILQERVFVYTFSTFLILYLCVLILFFVFILQLLLSSVSLVRLFLWVFFFLRFSIILLSLMRSILRIEVAMNINVLQRCSRWRLDRQLRKKPTINVWRMQKSNHSHRDHWKRNKQEYQALFGDCFLF